MKKGFALFTVIAFLSIGNLSIFAQDTTTTEEVVPTETVINEETSTDGFVENETTEESSSAVDSEEETFHQIIKQKFMEGGPEFMGIVLLCLILGLAYFDKILIALLFSICSFYFFYIFEKSTEEFKLKDDDYKRFRKILTLLVCISFLISSWYWINPYSSPYL